MSGMAAARPPNQPNRLMPPPLELSWPVGAEALVSSGHDTVVAVFNWRAHSTGYLFTLVVWESDDFPEFPGPELMSMAMGTRGKSGAGPRVECRYDDGSWVATQPPFPEAAGAGGSPFLGVMGFHSQRRPSRADFEYWLTPVALLGSLRVTVEWGARGVPTTGILLPNALLRAAAGKVRSVDIEPPRVS